LVVSKITKKDRVMARNKKGVKAQAKPFSITKKSRFCFLFFI